MQQPLFLIPTLIGCILVVYVFAKFLRLSDEPAWLKFLNLAGYLLINGSFALRGFVARGQSASAADLCLLIGFGVWFLPVFLFLPVVLFAKHFKPKPTDR